MKLRIVFLAVLAVLLPFVATGCGDDSTGDLSRDDIVKQLEKSGVPEAQAPCVADALKKADFTKDELNNISKKQDFSSGKGKAYIDAVTKCVTGGSTGITTPPG